ncbi:MAG: bile acid:sodium symporter [Planctomycetota bacterium]|nr:bile acid:sodium symporter [Planctomycetota bacterium]MDA1178526.1 bile acid:sodium symporter [Planctomycetota bacterium]
MDFLRRQWFLLALVVILAIGFTGWRGLEPITKWRTLHLWIVSGTLFCMSLPLQTTLIGRALARPWAAILAVFCNFCILPLFAWPIAMLLPRPLAMGLLVTASTPCTLASAAVWIRRAGGNDAIAMVVTILTNSTCFLVTPIWLLWFTRTKVDLDWQKMVGQLALLVVAPMVLAQALQQIGPIGRWAFARKQKLSLLAQTGILSMVLVGAINSGREISQTKENLPPFAWLQMIAACASLHVLGLVAGFTLGRVTRLAREEWIAVGIAGSQKTLMVGLQIALEYFGGLTILPMVTYHVSQLLIDTLVADRLRANQTRHEAIPIESPPKGAPHATPRIP